MAHLTQNKKCMTLVEMKNILVEEMPYLGGILIVLLVLLLIAFYKSLISALVLWGFFSLEFVVVGYLIGVFLPLNRLERTVIGISGAIATFGILSYFLGLIGIHVKYHSYIIFLIEISVLAALFMMKTRKRVSAWKKDDSATIKIDPNASDDKKQ